ncbi:AAA family ATPase [Aestuariimicrobium ganziense]|uniref:AAA family ATPase n=1 Tax=Aestuariimicrobium ganziense TaxID=2773677 RepID=UPI0019419204|nr:AAA family ATPase [Aestuariimicrobium ganziense]
MSRVILLNGTPGSGKSTLAEAWMLANPERRAVVEVDRIKHALPMWPEDAQAAGLRARELALMAVVATVEEGHDVMLPQFLARPEFADALAQAAALTGAESVELVLDVTPSQVTERLITRRETPDRPEQATNDLGVTPDEAADLVERVQAWAKARPQVRMVDASGTPDEVLARIEVALA